MLNIYGSITYIQSCTQILRVPGRTSAHVYNRVTLPGAMWNLSSSQKAPSCPLPVDSPPEDDQHWSFYQHGFVLPVWELHIKEIVHMYSCIWLLSKIHPACSMICKSLSFVAV